MECLRAQYGQGSEMHFFYYTFLFLMVRILTGFLTWGYFKKLFKWDLTDIFNVKTNKNIFHRYWTKWAQEDGENGTLISF